MKKKKFMIFAGKVKSLHDGQIHHITARELRHLYKLEKEECILIEENDGRFLDQFNKGEYIILWPRQRGDYEQFLARSIR